MVVNPNTIIHFILKAIIHL